MLISLWINIEQTRTMREIFRKCNYPMWEFGTGCLSLSHGSSLLKISCGPRFSHKEYWSWCLFYIGKE